MQRALDYLDRILTAVLLALVVAMVFSISTEIVLNAVVQPVASRLIGIVEGDLAAGPAGGESPSRTAQALHQIVGFVATASAPVNTASQTLLVWVGILGSALAFRMRAHLGVDALVRVYPPRIRLLLDYISTALVGLFSICVLGIGGYLVAARAFSLGSKMPGFEMLNHGWFYLVLIMTGLLNLVYCVYHVAHPKPVVSAASVQEER